MQTRTHFLAATLAATAALVPVAGHAQAPIRVVVNGSPLTFPGTPPMQIKGSTLVPMRGIFEALGAAIRWDPASSTVTIQTVDQHVASLPPAPGNGPVSGEVTGLYTTTTPTQITVRSGGENRTIPLSAGTIILRSASGQAATQVPLGRITPGDQVTVQRGPDGTATVIAAVFGEVKGTVVSIGHLASGNAALTLDSGRVVALAADAPITFAGAQVALSDIKPYETVVIRTNPSNSLGYGVAVSTGATPDPTPPGEVPPVPSALPASPLPPGAASAEVTSFTQSAKGPLRAGGTLTATLSGTPGGRATFAVPGVAEDLPMRETSPGVYVGSYTVGRGVAASGAVVLGRLVANGVQYPLVQAPGTVAIDTQPPRIAEVGPARSATAETARPLIYAVLADGDGVGVNPKTARITLDGRDVTAEAAVTGTLLTYQPAAPLAGGPHSVGVAVADNAGNPASAGWSFQVSPGKTIQSFTTNEPAGRAVGAGSTVVFTLQAAPGGKAFAVIAGLARIPLAETDPGVYTGEYTVKAGDNAPDAPATAQFAARGGAQVVADLPSRVSVAGGPPPTPRITEPKNGGDVDGGSPLTVTGRAAAGSTVRVTLSFTSKAPGGILPVGGQSASKDVVTEKSGNWTAEDLPLEIKTLISTGPDKAFGDRDTVFTVSATALDTAGNPASDPATVQVRPE